MCLSDSCILAVCVFSSCLAHLFLPSLCLGHMCHCLFFCLYWAVQWSWSVWVNALCNLLHKKSREVAASLPGRFVSRHCFTLRITVEVEPRIAKQYKCHHCCSCKNYWGKGDGGWKKSVFASVLADQKIESAWKKCVLGHPIARATTYCLLPDTFHSDYGLQKCL